MAPVSIMPAHEVDYLARVHWHGLRYRIGEMIGLDRRQREAHMAVSYDDDGPEVTPQRVFGYRRPEVIAVRN